MPTRHPLASLLLLVILTPGAALGWADLAHQLINERAQRHLPEAVRDFFSRHGPLISALAVKADQLKRGEDQERVCHFFKPELFEKPPYSGFPRELGAAMRKYGIKPMLESGILPWRTEEIERDLEAALKRGDVDAIIENSGHLGHYLGDLFQPLHVTSNHNGQETGNRGIHFRFERELVELHHAESAAWPESPDLPAVGDDVMAWIFDRTVESNALVTRILEADRAAAEKDDRYGTEYYAALEQSLGKMCAQRLAGAAKAMGMFWTRAWEKAGKPALPLDQMPRGELVAEAYVSFLGAKQLAGCARLSHGEAQEFIEQCRYRLSKDDPRDAVAYVEQFRSFRLNRLVAKGERGEVYKVTPLANQEEGARLDAHTIKIEQVEGRWRVYAFAPRAGRGGRSKDDGPDPGR